MVSQTINPAHARALRAFSRRPQEVGSAAELLERDAEFPRPADLDQRAPERKCPPGQRAVSEDLDAGGRLRLPHVHARQGAEAQVAEVAVDETGPRPQQAAAPV